MDRIKQVLKYYYNMEVTNIQSQQGGWASLAYKVSNEKHSYFLKIYEKSRASTPTLTKRIDAYVPVIDWLYCNSELKERITVPLFTTEGNYKCEDDKGVYLLYDFIDGTTIGERLLTEKQVQQLNKIITHLHLYDEAIPVKTESIKEDFSVPFLEFFKGILNSNNEHMAIDVREIVNGHKTQIDRLVSRVEKLSESLQRSDLRMALCHTDLHYWNLMEFQDELILIDWEGLKLAPVEADLMFLIDQPYFHEFLTSYKEKHSNFELNHDALHFYQGRRKLEDIGEFIEQLIFESLPEQERMNIVDYLKEELRSISI